EGLWLRHGRNSIHRWNLLIKFSSRILLFCGRYDTDISFRLAQPLRPPFWAACSPQDGRAAVPPTAALPILGRRLWAAAIVANYCQRALVHLAVFADALRCVLVRT